MKVQLQVYSDGHGDVEVERGFEPRVIPWAQDITTSPAEVRALIQATADQAKLAYPDPPVADALVAVADQESVDSHAVKQGVGYADAWRYYERQGYDMSCVRDQYS